MNKDINEKDINIFIYTHKDFECPVSNPIYKILTENDLNREYALRQYDVRTGDNIIWMGPMYSELKGHYWVWKNIHKLPKYIGFCHYRRYFDFLDVVPNSVFKYPVSIFEPEILTSNGNLQTIKRHYCDIHYASDLNLCRDVVKDMYPDYLEDFDAVCEQSTIYSCNSFIMPRKTYVDYMNWLFGILFEFDRRLGITCYQDSINLIKKRGNYDKQVLPPCDFVNTPEYQARIDGFLSERLMTLYMYHNFDDNINIIRRFNLQ